MRELVRKLRELFEDTHRGVVADSTATVAPAPDHDCIAPVVDPHDIERAELLVSERRQTVTMKMSLQLRCSPGANGHPQPFADRREGVPCPQANCGYRYVASPVSPSHRAAADAARRHRQYRGRLMRYLVDLELRKAVAVDCMDLRDLDERTLRDNEPRAVAYLRALRDAGADLLWIRGSGGRVGVVFTGSVGSTIKVVEEGIYALEADGSWSQLSTASSAPVIAAGHPRLRREKLPRVFRWSYRRNLLLLAWQLLVAVVCCIAAPALVALMGIEVRVPLWVMLLISLPLGWLLARMAYRSLKPYLQIARQILTAVTRLSDLESEWRDNRDFLRTAATEILEESAEDKDEDQDEGQGKGPLQPAH